MGKSRHPHPRQHLQSPYHTSRYHILPTSLCIKNLWKLLSASPFTKSCKGWSPGGKHILLWLFGQFGRSLFPFRGRCVRSAPCPGTRQQRGADSRASIPAGRGEHSLPGAGWKEERLNEWTNEWVSSFAFPAALIFSFLLFCRGAGSGLSSELGYLKVMSWWHK